MIHNFGREIVAYANYLVLKFIKYIWLKKHFFLLSNSRPGKHLWHKYPALLEIPSIQLLDLNSLNIYLLWQADHVGNVSSFDILEK